MASDKPDYFDDFEPNRGAFGAIITSREMERRLSHYLHVPQKYGARLIAALDHVIEDALIHGEGIRIKNAGTLTLVKHPNETVTIKHKTVPRAKMYRYRWVVSAPAKRFIRKITKFYFKGELDDYFSDPENTKFQID